MAEADGAVVTALGARRAQKPLRRIAVLSIHTSPLEQPGVGDAGGMNVYIDETTRRLAEAGVACEVFTRATSSHQPPVAELAPGVTVRHITAGPFEGLRKDDLPGQLCAVTAGVMRAEAARPEGWFDLVHSHYWLSGQVGWLAAERWGVPLVHSMHTMAKVKNAELAAGDAPEPNGRVIGEEQVVAASSRLIANTAVEAQQLIRMYGADPTRVDVIHPGVDLDAFHPGDRRAARRVVGVDENAILLLFVGRIQPLKAPDIVIETAARLVTVRPDLAARLQVVICGGPSGSGLDRPEALIELSAALGMTARVRFEPPGDRARLRDLYRAADLVLVPSYSESFGLVAVEAQACGTPVVAADVGGLRTAVADGRSGVLVAGHDPHDYADVVARLIDEPRRRARMGVEAREHAEAFSWTSTTAGLLASYRAAIDDEHFAAAARLTRRA